MGRIKPGGNLPVGKEKQDRFTCLTMGNSRKITRAKANTEAGKGGR